MGLWYDGMKTMYYFSHLPFKNTGTQFNNNNQFPLEEHFTKCQVIFNLSRLSKIRKVWEIMKTKSNLEYMRNTMLHSWWGPGTAEKLGKN